MGDKVTTIQATSKRWKAALGLGGIGFIVGWIGFLTGAYIDSTAAIIGFGLLIIISFIVYLIGRIGKWWFHD